MTTDTSAGNQQDPTGEDDASAIDSNGNVDSNADYSSHLWNMLPTPPKKPHLPQIPIKPETARVVWRDVFFIMLGSIAMSIIGYVETNAMDADKRSGTRTYHGTNMEANPFGIVDTGFILTFPLYEYLKENRDINDMLAGLNSFILIFPSVYVAYVTVWTGDYSCVFRVLAVQMLRSFCGWFTYLPPDPTYLNSYYDFPDFVQCLFKDCHAENAGSAPEVLPFVSFFSGHVATLVVVGNQMVLSTNKTTQKLGILTHILNVLQIVRLLATRGHYSIDIIIGWYVAVYVSAPAGRLGRYYSKGTATQVMLPKSPTEAFEYVTGVANTRQERRMSALMHRPEVQEALRAIELEEKNAEDPNSETTVRILEEAASKIMKEHATALQKDLSHLQQRTKQAMIVMRDRARSTLSDRSDTSNHGDDGKKEN